MQRTLVFVPIAPGELSAIGGTPELTNRPAHTVTAELMTEFGYRHDQVEEAEYAAMVLASVAALSAYGARLVLVAEVDSRLVGPAPDRANGQCTVAHVPPTAITCWFADEADVDPSAAAAAAKGLGIDEAWETDAVSDLVQGHQLLWNDVEEYHRAR